MSIPEADPAPRALRRCGAGAFGAVLAMMCACAVSPVNAQTRSLDDYLRIAETNSPVLKDQAYQRDALAPVSYTHLTLPTSDLV